MCPPNSITVHLYDPPSPIRESSLASAGCGNDERGSSIFEGEADIVLTLGRPEGNHKETARVLEGIGRQIQ